MIQCVMNRDTLHQYHAIVPYGCTIEMCMDDSSLYEKLLAEPIVMILGRFGELMGLNLISAYMVEQLFAGKSSEEILKSMFFRYARDAEGAKRIAQDYFDLIYQMEALGYAKIT